MIQNKNKISLGICLGPFIIGRPAYPGEGGLEKNKKSGHVLIFSMNSIVKTGARGFLKFVFFSTSFMMTLLTNMQPTKQPLHTTA